MPRYDITSKIKFRKTICNKNRNETVLYICTNAQKMNEKVKETSNQVNKVKKRNTITKKGLKNITISQSR